MQKCVSLQPIGLITEVACSSTTIFHQKTVDNKLIFTPKIIDLVIGLPNHVDSNKNITFVRFPKKHNIKQINHFLT